MQKKITINQKEIEYAFKKSKRARRMRLTIYCDGSLNLTVPYSFSEKWAERFLREKSSWIARKIEEFKKYENLPYIKSSRKDYLKYKKDALQLVAARIEYFNRFYGCEYNRISIRNQKSRWGSCSINRNLNFNYKIALLPEEYRDYIIVHELCHLREFNHSERFWDLVSKTIPDYKRLRKEVRRM